MTPAFSALAMFSTSVFSAPLSASRIWPSRRTTGVSPPPVIRSCRIAAVGSA
jgi:hypothetical protein